MREIIDYQPPMQSCGKATPQGWRAASHFRAFCNHGDCKYGTRRVKDAGSLEFHLSLYTICLKIYRLYFLHLLPPPHQQHSLHVREDVIVSNLIDWSFLTGRQHQLVMPQ